jgi:putative transcriptional regulator
MQLNYNPMVKPELKSGSVLLAEPFMLDANFKRTAILLTEHGDTGTIGFIMNRPVGMKITELVTDFPEMDTEVFFGGPVQTDTLHYLHNAGDLLADATQIAPGVYWGGDYDQLKFLIKNELILSRDIRFFIGYSGWTQGQLVDELRYGSWVSAPMDQNYLFNIATDELWSTIMDNKGEAFSVIADMPDEVSFN